MLLSLRLCETLAARIPGLYHACTMWAVNLSVVERGCYTFSMKKGRRDITIRVDLEQYYLVLVQLGDVPPPPLPRVFYVGDVLGPIQDI